jgi:hypothetical protein
MSFDDLFRRDPLNKTMWRTAAARPLLAKVSAQGVSAFSLASAKQDIRADPPRRAA